MMSKIRSVTVTVWSAIAWVGRGLWRPTRWAGRGLRRWWRSITWQGLFKVVLIAILVATLSQAYVVVSIRLFQVEQKQRGEDIKHLLTTVNNQTSPKAQARQNARIIEIINTVDCNTRIAFDDAIHQLVLLGIPEASSVSIVTKQCRRAGVATTTTTGGHGK